MKKTRWFGVKDGADRGGEDKAVADTSDPLFAAFFRLLARAPAEKPAAVVRTLASPPLDSGADACWTASLRRGDDLPPCRLSILIASGARSAMRLEPFGRETDAKALLPRAMDLDPDSTFRAVAAEPGAGPGRNAGSPYFSGILASPIVEFRGALYIGREFGWGDLD